MMITRRAHTLAQPENAKKPAKRTNLDNAYSDNEVGTYNEFCVFIAVFEAIMFRLLEETKTRKGNEREC
jgi:hypothetical protein